LTVNTNHVTALSVDRRLSLWTQWIALRNGGHENIDDILSPTLIAHLPRTGTRPARIAGRADLLAWAASVRFAFLNFELSVEVGPILGVHLISGRWKLRGLARSSGPWGPPGTVATTSGVDIVRLDAGRVVELWVNADCVDAAAEAAPAVAADTR
jgi:hypothetical protein